MATRTTTKQVTFRRPFLLAGFEALQAAGTYAVDTDEEMIDALSYPVWRRTGTTLHLLRSGAMEFVPIDPEELGRALLRDGAQPRSPARWRRRSRTTRTSATLSISIACWENGADAMNITIYHNPGCGTSRNALAAIRAAGHEPVIIEYLKAPPTREELKSLIARMGVKGASRRSNQGASLSGTWAR